jgi:predicted NAD/FAD-binding protein
MKIAIVGTGVSGLTAAWHLARCHDVTVFEKNDEPGGHSHTVSVVDKRGELGLDTGFIVYNDRTYPWFSRMLADLEVETQPSEMSFSMRCDRCKVEYSGSGLRGLFARISQALRPGFHRMLLDILRFHREANDAIGKSRYAGHTVGEFLEERRYGAAFTRHYLLPMGGAIWSMPVGEFGSFPLQCFLAFFQSHGLLSVTGKPQWRTVTGGSQCYVAALTRAFCDRIRLGCGVTRVRRRAHGVEIEAGGVRTAFDVVVLAVHSDQALGLLADPSECESRALGAIRYRANEAILHTDARVLPSSPQARASWNVHLSDCRRASSVLTMTSDLNRLQRLRAAEQYCVTLNAGGGIAPQRVLRRIAYEHPCYSLGVLDAPRLIRQENGQRHTF